MYSALVDLVLGRKLAGPHDCRILRERFSHHRGAYGWTRKVRLGVFVLEAERNQNLRSGIRVCLRRINHFDYWRAAA